MLASNASQVTGKLNIIVVAGTLVILIAAIGCESSRVNPSSTASRRVVYTGRVIDATTERRIRNAKVSLEAQGVPPVIYTDSEGIFSFPLEDVDDELRIRVRVEADGYQKFDRNVSLHSSSKPIEDIRLEAVSAARPAVKPSTSGIDTTQEETTTSTPEKAKTSERPITYQEVDGIGITLNGGRIVGDTVRFEFEVVNHNPGDKRIDLFGKGSFGNGHSRMIADGREYAADIIYFGDGSAGIVGRRLPADTPLKATLIFKGVPQDLHLINVLDFAYSYNNLRPKGWLRFTKITLQ